MKNQFILSVEHASNFIPEEYLTLFQGADELLSGHRGYDIGIKRTAETIASFFSLTVVTGEHSRLLVDLNRSPQNRNVFSEFTRKLKRSEKETLLSRFHLPYRTDLEDRIRNKLEISDFVYHLSLHSFTPMLNGKERKNDIGILYDPSRDKEKAFSQHLKQELKKVNKGLSIRFNYPYQGVSDGMVTHFRKVFTAHQYAGIELEINQKVFGQLLKENELVKNLLETFRNIISFYQKD